MKNRNITAQFTYSLTTLTVGSGTVTRSPNLTGYTPGQTKDRGEPI